MKTRTMSLLAFLAASLIGCNTTMTPAAKTDATVELKMAMRKLWEEHITYTRNYIISALAGLEDADKVAERLLRNQDDIGGAIKPYYGDEAGDKLAALLRDHILIAPRSSRQRRPATTTAWQRARRSGPPTARTSQHS